MMRVWLDVLQTPMAAPEPTGLRALRLAILSLAVALAGSIVTLKPLRGLFGPGAVGAVVGMLLVLIVVVPIYAVRKIRLDDAHLQQLVDSRADAEDLR